MKIKNVVTGLVIIGIVFCVLLIRSFFMISDALVSLNPMLEAPKAGAEVADAEARRKQQQLKKAFVQVNAAIQGKNVADSDDDSEFSKELESYPMEQWVSLIANGDPQVDERTKEWLLSEREEEILEGINRKLDEVANEGLETQYQTIMDAMPFNSEQKEKIQRHLITSKLPVLEYLNGGADDFLVSVMNDYLSSGTVEDVHNRMSALKETLSREDYELFQSYLTSKYPGLQKTLNTNE